jgi:hypothetical protein
VARRVTVALPAPTPDFREAYTALARATKLADVVSIRDQAEAVRVVCAKAKASLAVQNQATELRLRAERKAGQLLQAQKDQCKSQGGRPTKNPSHGGTSFRSYEAMLKAIDLPKSTAHRFEQEARIPETFFEQHIRKVVRQPDGELTGSGLRREWSAHKPRVKTNVITSTGSRDARDVKREATTWLDTFSIASKTDPAFLKQIQALRRVLKTTSLVDTVTALVARAHREWC